VTVLRSRSPAETRAAGEALGRVLRRAGAAGAVVALVGPLGAGKTCFVQGLARGLGAAGYVRSPTFTLIHEHRGPVPLYHVDLYRLVPAELDTLGLEEVLEGPGVVAVEWADRAEAPGSGRDGVGGPAAVLPLEHLRVELAFGEADDERLLALLPCGDRYRRIAEEVAACVSSR
jgi:tRNA threonylcarbamoyladenosine biosynthesis protein TsaE